MGCLLSGSMVGLMVTFSERAYATPRIAAPRAPTPAAGNLSHTPTGDTQTLRGRSGSVSVGSPDAHKVLFEPSKCLWQVSGLIRNAFLPLLPSCWGLSFVLGCRVSFLVGSNILLWMVAAVSCNFGVLTGDDARTPFYSTIFLPPGF